MTPLLSHCSYRQPPTVDPLTNQDQTVSSNLLCVTGFHTLPVEILAHIFILCTVSNERCLPYPAWLPITQVCHRWRTIALRHPPLWTSITRGLSLQWIKAFMARSQNMLMDLDIHLTFSGVRPYESSYSGVCPKDIILLLPGFMQIRTLCLTGAWEAISHILYSLRVPQPIYSLSISCFANYHQRLTLPENLFPCASLLTHYISGESMSPSDACAYVSQFSRSSVLV